MTVIAALSQGGQVTIGSNTGYTLAQDSVIDDGNPPWVLFQDWALGFTGSALAMNVCKSDLSSLKKKLVTERDVVIEIGKILTDYDIGIKKHNEPQWSFGLWCILVHKSGKIWDLDQGLCLGAIPEGTFWARGSGEQYALGAARALMNSKAEYSCEEVVKSSVESAIFNNLYCPGRIYTEQL